MQSFTEVRQTFVNLGLASAGVSWCVWNFLEATGSPIVVFLCDSEF